MIAYENQRYYDIFVIHEIVVYLQTYDLRYGDIFLNLHHDVQVVTILGCSVFVIFYIVFTCIATIIGITSHPILILSVLLFEYYEHSSIKIIAAFSILLPCSHEHTWKKYCILYVFVYTEVMQGCQCKAACIVLVNIAY
jgi:hypothetical protein